MANEDISLFQDPQAAAILRQQKMAELLQQQALSPIEVQSYKGIQAPIHPLSVLSKVLQGYMSGQQQDKADEAAGALQKMRSDEVAAAVPNLYMMPAKEAQGVNAPIIDPNNPNGPRQYDTTQGAISDATAARPRTGAELGQEAGTLISSQNPQMHPLAQAVLEQQKAQMEIERKQALMKSANNGAPPPGVSPTAWNLAMANGNLGAAATLAQTGMPTKEGYSPLQRLQDYRDTLIAKDPKDPRIKEVNSAIEKETTRAPTINQILLPAFNAIAGGKDLTPAQQALLQAAGRTPPAPVNGLAPGTKGVPEMNTSEEGYYTKIVPNTGGLTQARIDQAALARATGAPEPTGRSNTGAGLLQNQAISNRSAELNTGGNIAANKAQLVTKTAALRQQQEYASTLDRSVTTADAGFNQVINAFKGKVMNQTMPIANIIANGAQYGLSPRDIAAARAGLQEVRNEYQLVFSRGGKNSDKVRETVDKLIDGNLSLGDLAATNRELQAQGDINKKGAYGQIAKIQSEIGSIVSGKAKPDAGNNFPAATGGNAPPVSALQEGHDTTFKNGQVWRLQGGKPVRVSP